MHKPIAYQREKGVELRTIVLSTLSVSIIIANVFTVI